MKQVPAYSNGDPNNGNSPPQQDYVTRSDKTLSEHQRPYASGADLSGATQSSAKPKQQA
jgi:hypothetical protein